MPTGNGGNITSMKTLREMLAEARQIVPEEGPEDLARRLKSDTPPVVIDPSTPVVLYCQTGLRSVLAAKALKELGYQTVINLQGGYQKWAQSGFPVVKDIPMTADQIQ